MLGQPVHFQHRRRSTGGRRNHEPRKWTPTLFFVLSLGLLGAGIHLLLGVSHRAQAHPVGLPNAANPVKQTNAVLQSKAVQAAGQLTISRTDVTWYGQTVYAVKNVSKHLMSHITVYTWSNHICPVLYIGLEPVQQSDVQPLTSPPYELAPGHTLSFVGVSLKPEFSVIWTTKDGVAYYENLRL